MLGPDWDALVQSKVILAQQLLNTMEQIKLLTSNQMTVAFTQFCKDEKKVKDVAHIYSEEELEFTIKRISTTFDGFILDV